MWRSEDGKLDLEEFSALLDTLSSSSEDDRCMAIGRWKCTKLPLPPLFRDQQLFSLLDRDENGFIDFRDILVFLFSTEVSLSPEDARLRSFRFYDRSVLTWKERGFLELFLSSDLATRWSLRWRCSAHWSSWDRFRWDQPYAFLSLKSLPCLAAEEAAMFYFALCFELL